MRAWARFMCSFEHGNEPQSGTNCWVTTISFKEDFTSVELVVISKRGINVVFKKGVVLHVTFSLWILITFFWTIYPKMTIFWVVAPCTLVEVYRHYRGAVAMVMEAASTSKMSAIFYQTTRLKNPEDGHLYDRRLDNQKSHAVCIVSKPTTTVILWNHTQA
jgi:hypothetical protein